MLARISGVVLLILGVVILGLGIQLATEEGSLFYLFMAAGLLLSGYLITRRRRSGLAVYAVLLLATLADVGAFLTALASSITYRRHRPWNVLVLLGTVLVSPATLLLLLQALLTL